MLLTVLLFVFLANGIDSQYYGNYFCQPGRDVVVHLFEWKWSDIQKECSWLAQHNFCAIQVSPPSEHRIVTDPPYPWWQRYQPVSYSMRSRSGDEAAFRSMVAACNDLGVYIYIDGVINHMTGAGWGTGSDGSAFNGDDRTYPGVPYGPGDFNGASECPTSNGEISDFDDPIQCRNCMLVGLRDLKGGTAYVQDQVAGYLSKLVNWGVAGFRIDAAKHMWPADIRNTFAKVSNLNTQWFPANTRPYIYQEVIYWGGSGPNPSEYSGIGRVTEFRHGSNIAGVVRKQNGQKMSYLLNYGQDWGQLNGLDAFVFIDNHDTQRTGDLNTILTFRQSRMYKIANAFQLAWQYGHVRIMSSYNWNQNIQGGHDTNEWVGPPSNGGNTNDVACFNGDWICEHRWRQIYNMVRFHNVALNYGVSHSWTNGNDAIGFGRSGRGYIVINNENFSISETLQTGLPAGQYCDVITCDNNRPPCGNSGGACRGEITVNGSGQAFFSVPNDDDPVIAIHI